MGLILIDYFDTDIDEKWLLEFLIVEASLEEAMMNSLKITPPPDHISELYYLFFKGVEELNQAIGYLDDGLTSLNAKYSGLGLEHILKAALIFTDTHHVIT